MKTALLAIVFLQGSATTSTEPVVFTETETTADPTVEVREDCLDEFFEVLWETIRGCRETGRPVIKDDEAFSELTRCVERAREQAEPDQPED